MPGRREGVDAGADLAGAPPRGHQGHARRISAPREVIAVRPSIARRLLIAAAITSLAIPAGVAGATPPQGPPPGPTPTPIARGTFSERVKIKAPNLKAKLKPSDFVVIGLHFAPGATTGWHTHPGP